MASLTVLYFGLKGVCNVANFCSQLLMVIVCAMLKRAGSFCDASCHLQSTGLIDHGKMAQNPGISS